MSHTFSLFIKFKLCNSIMVAKRVNVCNNVLEKYDSLFAY